ncbi:TetR family transcriptional regulator [Corynebacterium sp. HMSC034A01]|uniref:TetR family transcriptional regulator n=1 Tax=Corynebacterium sp. HMSC034A01 TaxID=1739295 RepID=UPI0008AA2D3F|nr:TetR family transcriptional regulator [Corynebacterium sp. HMSC034A01]OHR18205.1 TetR family transcriptional regulator [Corynebacterium sp. HMSC034A01]
MRGFSAEQLLAVADEYCAFHGCQVRSFAALAASAAVPSARLHGVPVFDTVEAAAAALAETIRALQPLSGFNAGFNAGFADVAAEVYRRWVE